MLTAGLLDCWIAGLLDCWIAEKWSALADDFRTFDLIAI
jgi:hypothetical protein